jgi:pyruvate carboxylase subunit B
MRYLAQVKGQSLEIEVGLHGEVRIEGRPHKVDLRSIGGLPLYSLLVDNRSYEVFVDRIGNTYNILLGGELYPVHVEDERTRQLWRPTSSRVRKRTVVQAPMPGLVVSIKVKTGDAVQAGEGLITLEAMKMENELPAPHDGVIESVRVHMGDVVEQNQPLVILR